jgi:type IV pilus assembly protein PilW
MKHVRGFTLVEILIGLVLGLFLGTGIIQLFIANKKTYTFQEGTSLIQENGRFALEVMQNSIRMAGFTGCTTLNPVNVVLNNPGDWWKDMPNNTIRGYDGTAAGQNFPPNPNYGTTQGDRVAGTDAIIVLGGNGSLNQIVPGPFNTLTLNTLQRIQGAPFTAGNIVIACSSQSNALFQISGIQGATSIQYAAGANPPPGNSNGNLTGTSNNYVGSDAVVTEYNPTAFFIGISVSRATRSLYQAVFEPTSNTINNEELVEGVWDMQLTYGVNTDTDAEVEVYQDATTVTNNNQWGNVRSVRVNLLLVSLDNVLNEPQTYMFPNDTDDSNISGRLRTAIDIDDERDLRLYQTFSTTIGIRNRLK